MPDSRKNGHFVHQLAVHRRGDKRNRRIAGVSDLEIRNVRQAFLRVRKGGTQSRQPVRTCPEMNPRVIDDAGKIRLDPAAAEKLNEDLVIFGGCSGKRLRSLGFFQTRRIDPVNRRRRRQFSQVGESAGTCRLAT